MSTHRRISSLLRELADAFDDLERERAPRRTRRPSKGEQSADINPAVTERVRRGLRRAGVRA